MFRCWVLGGSRRAPYYCGFEIEIEVEGKSGLAWNISAGDQEQGDDRRTTGLVAGDQEQGDRRTTHSNSC